MPSITEAAGLLASLTGFLVGLPHAWRVWQSRHDPVKLSGIAMSSQVLSLAGNVLWSVYAIGIGSLWVGAPNAVNGPVAILVIVVLRRVLRGAGEPLLFEHWPGPPSSAAALRRLAFGRR